MTPSTETKKQDTKDRDKTTGQHRWKENNRTPQTETKQHDTKDRDKTT